MMRGKPARLATPLAAALALCWAGMLWAAEPEGPAEAGKQAAQAERPAPMAKVEKSAEKPAKPEPQGKPQRPRQPEMLKRGPQQEQSEQRAGAMRETAQVKNRVAEAGRRLAELIRNNPNDKEAIQKAVDSLSQAIAAGIREDLSARQRFTQQSGGRGGPLQGPLAGRWGQGWGMRGMAQPGGWAGLPNPRQRVEERRIEIERGPKAAGPPAARSERRPEPGEKAEGKGEKPGKGPEAGKTPLAGEHGKKAAPSAAPEWQEKLAENLRGKLGPEAAERIRERFGRQPGQPGQRPGMLQGPAGQPSCPFCPYGPGAGIRQGLAQRFGKMGGPRGAMPQIRERIGRGSGRGAEAWRGQGASRGRGPGFMRPPMRGRGPTAGLIQRRMMGRGGPSWQRGSGQGAPGGRNIGPQIRQGIAQRLQQFAGPGRPGPGALGKGGGKGPGGPGPAGPPAPEPPKERGAEMGPPQGTGHGPMHGGNPEERRAEHRGPEA